MKLSTLRQYLADIVKYFATNKITHNATAMTGYMVGQPTLHATTKVNPSYPCIRKQKKTNLKDVNKPKTSLYNEIVVFVVPGDIYRYVHIETGCETCKPKLHYQEPQVFTINHMVNENYMCKLYMT